MRRDAARSEPPPDYPDLPGYARGGDSRLIERTGSSRPTTAQEFIGRNPDRWEQMKRDMQKGAGRG